MTMRPFQPPIRCLALAAGLALAATAARASFITLTIETRSSATDTGLVLNVRVTNQGDEAALSIRTEAALDGTPVVQTLARRLDVGESAEGALNLGALPATPGVYAATLRTHYTDLNGYPFSAPQVVTVPTNATTGPMGPVEAGMEPARLTRDGALRVVLRPMSATNIDARVRLVLPREIQAEPAEHNVVLFPGQDRVCEFALRNTSGRPGSRYATFAAVEYEYDGRHDALVRTSTIEIDAPQPLWSARRWLWPVAGAVLIGAFVALQFAGRRGRPAPAARKQDA
jgi:hypothetical protein